MFLGNMEFVAQERQKDLLEQAKRARLIETLQRQRSNNERISRKVTNRLGTQMVKWGLKLQGYDIAPPSQIAVAGGANAGRSQN